VFNLGCVLINAAQFVLLLPLRVLHLLPFGRRLYDAGIRRSKGAFGTLLGEVYGSARSPPPSPEVGHRRGVPGATFQDADRVSIVMMCSWFAPTNLVITFETKGPGKFTEEELEKLVEMDSRGGVSLNLPAKSVLIANHQVKSAFTACSDL